MLRLWEPGNELSGVAQGDQLATIGQNDGVIKAVRPAHLCAQWRQPFWSTSSLNPAGNRGGSAALQTGQGSPAAPQSHGRGPNQDLSGWASQTQRQSSHRAQNLMIWPFDCPKARTPTIGPMRGQKGSAVEASVGG
jgi:hypothetical protein